jgi:hypothetical protein
VRSRKSIFVRWAEEAEARQVYLSAGLVGDAAQTQTSSNPQALLPSWSGVWDWRLRRLRNLLRPNAN